MPSGVVYFTLCINIANLLFVSSYLQSRVPFAQRPQAAWERQHVTPVESRALLRPDVNFDIFHRRSQRTPFIHVWG